MIDIIDLNFSQKRIVYKKDDIVAGYIVIEDVIEVINIVDVFVEEGYRRKGIASKLIDYVFDMYRMRNIRFMLEVRKDNIPALNLYKKYGFKQIYVRRKYYKDEDGIIMEARR